MKFVILTGMSGAGKSTAIKMMEDIGFYCVDNLPIALLEKFVELSDLQQNTELQKVAVGIDIRNGQALTELRDTLNRIKAAGVHCEILFLDAEDSVLVKRYKETRRNHPLSGNERVDKGIEEERKQMAFLKERADYIIDTSRLLTRELKTELDKIFVQNQDYKNLFITVLSFGFKYGIPADSDLVFDVRFLPNPYYVEGLRAKTGNDEEIQDYVFQFQEALPNPYYVEGLRAKTGNDEEIQDYVFQFQEARVFVEKLEDMLNFLIPNYITEGKNQLVIAVGCTGGKHRSVTLANELYRRLSVKKEYGVKIEHRDIGKDALRGK